MSTQQSGRVIRALPDRRVVVEAPSGPVTARTVGVPPRPGAMATIVNPGSGWVVLTWR